MASHFSDSVRTLCSFKITFETDYYRGLVRYATCGNLVLYKNLHMRLLVIYQLFEASLDQVIQLDACSAQVIAFDSPLRDSFNDIFEVLGSISWKRRLHQQD